MKHHVYIGLGSNLGDRAYALQNAIKRLELAGLKIVQVSRFIETPPAFFLNQPDFVNACAHFVTSLHPHEVLATLLRVETEMGRIRTMDKGPRTIDLDLLFFDSIILNEDRLTIPHPGVLERRFVLEPLVEIAPALVHPITNVTMTEALNVLH